MLNVMDQLVTLETARLAYKLEYDGKYLYSYRDGVLVPNATFEPEFSVDVESLDLDGSDVRGARKIVQIGELLACPTQTALSKWIRKRYKVYVHVDCNASGWYWEIEKTNGTHIKNSGEEGPNLGGCWDDYEECLENALREVCMMMILKGELW